MLKLVGSLVIACVLFLHLAAFAQGGVAEERSAQAPAFDEPTAMNVAQKATMSLGGAERQLAQARKLAEKIKAESDAKKRAKLETKREKALMGAVSGFREGLSYNVKSIEGWAGLGTAYRELGKFQEALLAHVEGMKLDAADRTNFVGWTESAMDALLFGQVTTAHGQFLENNPLFAALMLEIIEGWYEKRQTDPGDVKQADLDRLKAWIADQKK